MHTLQNKIFTLKVDSEEGVFSILTQDQSLPDLVNARVNLSFTEKTPVTVTLKEWQIEKAKPEWMELPEHGKVESLSYKASVKERNLECKLTFGIVQEYPLVIWKVEVTNSGSNPVSIQSIDLLEIVPQRGGGVKWGQARAQKELGFFSNGWQSWSPSQWYPADGRMNASKLGALQLPMIKNPGTPLSSEKGLFSSDFFAVVGDRTARTGFVLGSLSQKNHFTSIVVDFNDKTALKMWANGDDARLDPGCTMTTDWAVFNPILLDHRDPLDKYLEAVARENHVRVPEESQVGWCSWYHFYTKISEPIIQQNLKTIIDQQETLPIQLVQIDDGFESQIGDWFTFKSEFPNGVAPLAAEISREGLLPGLWLAPFILHPKAEVIQQHPEWLLRKANGKHAKAGYVWGAITEALDLTVPEALDYACRVVKTASAEWGYPYLKLDFLYAAAVECQYRDRTLTRAQVLRKGMEAIREAVGPEVTLLGCGAPLGSVLGLVEANRIGADVSGSWLPDFAGIQFLFKNEPAMPSARNSVRNILTRANLHGQWWTNDPDCLLVRADTKLSLAEVQSLASVISLTGGSLLVSDNLPKLPKDRLRIAECLLPVLGEPARVIDWFDSSMPAKLRLDQVNEAGEWHILAKFNWSDHPADISLTSDEYHLADGEYWVSEFWGGTTKRVIPGPAFEVKQVPAHGCVVTAWRRVQNADPVYLGSDLHISQGIELAEWKPGRKKVELTLRLPRKTSGVVHLWLPGKATSINVNGSPVEFNQDAHGVVIVPVQVDGFAHLEIGIE